MRLTRYQELWEAGRRASAGTNLPPKLILVILPEQALELRRHVKHWGEKIGGVPTQCVVSNHASDR